MLMPVLMFLKSAWFSGPEKGRFWCSRVFLAVCLGGESMGGAATVVPVEVGAAVAISCRERSGW
jgi:hypothetical protein